MKKYIALLLILTLVLSVLAGCSPKDEVAADMPEQSSESTDTPAPTEQPAEEPIVEVTIYNINGAYLVDVPDNLIIEKLHDDSEEIKVVSENWELMLEGTKGAFPAYAYVVAEKWEAEGQVSSIEQRPVGTFDGFYCRVVDTETALLAIVFDGPEPIVPHCRITLKAASGNMAEIESYLEDPVINRILDSIREPGDESGGAESMKTAAYSTASLTFSAPADWIEVINGIQVDTEAWRLVSGEDWEENPETEIITLMYWLEGYDDIDEILRSVQFPYPELQELGEVSKGGSIWRHFSASKNRNNDDVIYNAYLGEIDGRVLLISFREIAPEDPLIESILSSIKLK